MSKGLDALEEICSKGCDYCDKWHCENNLLCKTELGGCSKCVFYGNEKEIIEEELKALEIIKRLPNDFLQTLFSFIRDKWFKNEDFNAFIGWAGDETPILINEKEYDLLREVLL